jgi:hypothetical protein
MKRKTFGMLGQVKCELSDKENAEASGVVVRLKSCEVSRESGLASEPSEYLWRIVTER